MKSKMIHMIGQIVDEFTISFDEEKIVLTPVIATFKKEEEDILLSLIEGMGIKIIDKR